jgi:hypothetical protein
MLRRFGVRAFAPALNLALLAIWGATPRFYAYLWQLGIPNNPTENPLLSLIPLPRFIAMGLNAPVFLFSTFIVSYLPVQHTDQPVLLLMCPFVLWLWYLTGRWFDRRFGFLPEKTQPPKRRYLLVATAAIIGPVLPWSLYRIWYFLNGGMADWHGEERADAAIAWGMAGWVVLWEVMILMAMKRRSSDVHADAHALARK